MTKTFGKMLAATLVAAMATAAPASAAVLSIGANGKLTGASGVIVDGKSYDVEFLKGTCAEAFGSCEPGAFAFSTISAGSHAADALLTQVFVDVMIGGTFYAFDTDPKLTSGCNDSARCFADIPTGLAFNGNSVTGAFVNNTSTVSDSIGTFQLPRASAKAADAVWARFTPTIAAVPEPATWALMLAGFGMVGGVMRRRQRSRLRVTFA